MPNLKLNLNPKLIIIFLGVVIIAFVFLLTYAFKVNSQCVQNPLIYGAERVYEDIGEDLICSCSISGYDPFQVTKEGITSSKLWSFNG